MVVQDFRGRRHQAQCCADTENRTARVSKRSCRHLLLILRVREFHDSGVDIAPDTVFAGLVVVAFVDQLKLFLRL